MEVTDDVDERRIGEGTRSHPDAHARDRGDPHRAGKGRHLGQEPGLADACLATDEHDAGPTGGRALERIGQRSTLGDTASSRLDSKVGGPQQR